MRHIPNALTLLRMLLTVPLAWLLRDGRYDLSLAIALVAGFTDALDGYLAKRFSWQSRLGGLIDPVADKLLLIACFFGLAGAGALPWWLAALVRSHRRKFPSGLWKELPDHDRFVEHLAVLLRLAAVLHRSRTEVGEVTVVAGRRSLEVRFAPGWLEQRALPAADLLEEAELLRAGGFELKVSGLVVDR